MAGTSIHVGIGETDGSHPGSSDEIDPQLMNYVSFRQEAYLNYNATDDHIRALGEKMSTSAYYVQHDLPTDVLRTRNDYQSILELATREWTGYGAPENRDSALERWTFLASSEPNVPRRIRARAHSCLATGWFDRATEDPERWNIDSLHRAGSNANEAVSLGLTSPGALKTGFSIERQGFRRPEDNRFAELSTERFERLTDLWEAIDSRTAEIERASVKKDAKPPLKYACSAEGCGIQATKKLGLLRCAGKCPVVFKPSYCSKECQKMDWKRHKAFCKADAAKSSVPSLNASDDTTENSTTQRATVDPDSDKFEGRTSRPRRSNSKTLGSQTTKELRKVAEDINR